ncbi:MAG: ferritin-like domain-containing protein [Noviherbaspirillum sp.]
MKQQTSMGRNRTGVQMSPVDTKNMKSGMPPAGPVPAGDDNAIAEMRSNYIAEADQVGSIPLPGTIKGVASTGASMLTGNQPQLLLDKLGERAAFERAGTRLYDALITKFKAAQGNAPASMSLGDLDHIRQEEMEHFAMVANAIESMGGDPTAQTPSADLAGVESMGLMQVLTDPRTTLPQSLHAILVAELADNAGWEMLIELARANGQDAMVPGFQKALEEERNHLQQVRAWLEEATLGTAVSGSAPAGRDTGSSRLH